MTDPLLVLDGVDAWHGDAQVLRGVSLQVRPGEVLALLGRNGAGKSSLLKAVMGLMRRRGRIVFGGRAIDGWPVERIARAGMGYVPEDRRIFTRLSVRENLEVGRRPGVAGRWTVDSLCLLFPNLADMLARPAAQMSGGEQQMLAVARTLMGQPRCVLLDEPSEGVAPIVVAQMAEAVQAMAAEGVAVLLSEQNLGFAGRVARRACVLDQGALRFDGTLEALRADEALRRDALAI